MILIDIDPNAPHDDECNFWHGGVCDCKEIMRQSSARKWHCCECNYVNSYTGSTPCNCQGHCTCDPCERQEICSQ